MRYLVDSDWVIDYLEGEPDALQLLLNLADEGIAISIVTYMEVYQGVARNPRRQDAEEELSRFLENVPVLPISLSIARRCAELRETLRAQQKQVQRRALDLLIAATALEHSLTVVTRNLQDYSDVPTLLMHQPS
ncbi:MAG: type II toxin-antitoxin system VapC family toxin [Dehalococcoidia bacterium]